MKIALLFFLIHGVLLMLAVAIRGQNNEHTVWAAGDAFYGCFGANDVPKVRQITTGSSTPELLATFTGGRTVGGLSSCFSSQGGMSGYGTSHRTSGGSTIPGLSNEVSVSFRQPVQFRRMEIVGDVPAPADFDGDGLADLAVWRPSSASFYSKNSTDGEMQVIQFSQQGDMPVPSDYDGDGKADYALYNSATGTWSIRKSSNTQIATALWGEPGDVPVHNDYNGDGRVDLAIWRPSNGTWYIRHFGIDTFRIQAWGENGDTPVPAFYNR